MTYATPLQPVSEAIYAVLQDTALLALLSETGVQTDIPENPTFPFLWFEVFEGRQLGGFGTKPGTHTLPELDIRMHVFTAFDGGSEAQGILSRAIAVLSVSGALTVTGYRVCGTEPFHDSTIPVPDQLLNNVKVQEFVAMFRLYVEEA